jgi:hypothetical protein
MFYRNSVSEEDGFLATSVPVPASLLLPAPGLAGVAAMRRRLKKQALYSPNVAGRVSK